MTIPADARFRGVATLVLGGVGSRLDLPFERMDDLQLALLSILDAAGGDELSIEVAADDDGGVAVSVGPLAPGSAHDPGLELVLSRLSDGVEPSSRDGAEWLTVRLARPPESASAS